MATSISNGESGLSVRNKLNDIWHSLDLNEIASTIADTAVDVFVYDTRKDSDGGAWRKRTQHTSWYNETLNTATRGSRKEFPAVAVIVAESKQLTIYDGDDPDLPMWMVFSDYAGTDNINQPMFRTGVKASYSGISALNGIIAVSFDWIGDYSGGLRYVRFTADDGYYLDQTTAAEDGKFNGNIEQRNDALGFSGDYGIIVNRDANDVAMTVLPNAPIDAATGLPAVTIACATNGGVSVIKDDGTVVDINTTTESTSVNDIAFLSDAQIQVNRDNFSAVLDIPTSDITSNYWVNLPNYSHRFLKGVEAGSLNTVGTTTGYVKGAIKSASGLTKLAETATNPSHDMVSWITSDYNTGWMNGDIKLATLSDTDDTDVVGSGNLITDPSSFSDSNGLITETSGVISASGADTYIHTGVTTVLGQRYYAEVNHTAGSTCTFSVTDAPETTTIVSQGSLTGAGVVKLYFTGNGSTVKLRFSNNSTFTIQDIGIYAVELDRSVNNNGLIVNGTVTKDPVATGADLVGYETGYNVANYLHQPNVLMDYTNDFCVMSWSPDGKWTWQLRNDDAGSFTAYQQTAMSLFTASGGDVFIRANNYTQDLGEVGAGHIAIVHRASSGFEVYVNGTLKYTNSSNNTVADAYAYIGVRHYGPDINAGHSNQALFRISATAPSPEQIKKIYEDEKVLFQEGAGAVLAGTSDAVTALAYDEDTQELLVGTNQNTSVFRGLRRVETISGSASAISASNGLRVIED
jgi:hypothetical protein